jgi:hypothetical protein
MKKLPLFALAAVMALIAAACGGGTDSSDNVASLETETTTTAPVSGAESRDSEQIDTETAFLGLAQCLRDEGIEVADPTVDADGNVDLQGMFAAAEDLDQAQIQAAAEACSEYLEDVVPTFSNIDFTELQDDLLEFAGCMRDNGYDMPDPDFSDFGLPGGDGPSGGPFGELDLEDPAFEQALQACEDILAGFAGPAGPGNGG